MGWSGEHRAFAIETYFKNADSVVATQRLFRTHFLLGENETVPDRKTILLWVANFRATGSALKNKPPGRPRSVRTPQNVQAVIQAVTQSPQHSALKHAAAMGISDRSVRRILKAELQFHPYKKNVKKPTLQEQGIKVRKRDRCMGFRDAILQGLAETSSDLEAVNKFLDSAGSKLDYRTYGDILFDILLSGGILLPGGAISDDGVENGSISTHICVFGVPDESLETLKGYAQVFTKLIRRYKYLEKIFFEEMEKVLVYLRGYTEGNRIRLARCVAIWTSDSLLDPKVLIHLVQEHLIKDGLAVDFLCEVLTTAKTLRDTATVRTLLDKSGLDTRLMEFLPIDNRTDENLRNLFRDKGLGEIVNIQQSLLQEKKSSIKGLQVYLGQQLKENAILQDIIAGVKDIAKDIQEPQVITTIWNSIMASAEWRNDELVADQALKHLRIYVPLFAANTTTARGELQLLLCIQEYCYNNTNLMNVFQKIVCLFYKSEVLSEDIILKWYKDSHSAKGKSIFMVQMKKFVELIQNAETESEDSGEEEDED